MQPFVSVRNVTKRYDGRPVVDSVSLEIHAGQSVVIVGPSGSGKTTLLRMIAGLESPDDGEIWLDGRHVSAPRRIVVAPQARHIGFVFQDLALWPHMSVRDHLEFVLKAAGVSRQERVDRTGDVLTLVRIADMADRYPHQLSGGEQQRVALARALVGRPRLLLLDEPLSSLDPELRTALRTELLRLKRAVDVAMIYVSHDREDATVLADCVIQMRAGRVVVPGALQNNRGPA
jgi:ABC-type Fe3+/spermidine/putrescine transport system ATPase subunit